MFQLLRPLLAGCHWQEKERTFLSTSFLKRLISFQHWVTLGWNSKLFLSLPYISHSFHNVSNLLSRNPQLFIFKADAGSSRPCCSFSAESTHLDTCWARNNTTLNIQYDQFFSCDTVTCCHSSNDKRARKSWDKNGHSRLVWHRNII